MQVPSVSKLPLIYLGVSTIVGVVVGLTASFFAIIDRKLGKTPAEQEQI